MNALRFLAVFALTVVVAAGCQLHINLLPSPRPLAETTVSGEGKDKILIIPVRGFISNRPGKGFLGRKTISAVARMNAQIKRAEKDDRIKAVILEIDSPGGLVAASDMIYERLMRYKKKNGVKIVAFQSALATSGAYYVSAAADRIIAQPTTVTGSIGVILVKLSAQGLMEKLGVADDTVKAGDTKGFLRLYNTMTPEERGMMQEVLDAMHKRFKEVALAARGEVADPETSFDGRVFIAAEAKRRNLIDEIGYLPDAIEMAKELAGLEDATIIRYRRTKGGAPGIFAHEPVPAGMGGLYPDQLNLVNIDLGDLLISADGPAFLYYWAP